MSRKQLVGVRTADVLYRYEIQYTNYDDGGTALYLRELKVLEETEKTYLVQNHYFDKKRIRKSSYNAYGHAQKEKALAHFIRRTSKRVSWYKYFQEECETALNIAREMESQL